MVVWGKFIGLGPLCVNFIALFTKVVVFCITCSIMPCNKAVIPKFETFLFNIFVLILYA